ncbi:MAG TPA: lantibiotic dehydratase, partial [Nannocystaceae bacterium]|nr:lantibiotic dehydratase [Nannocystaceae bacterium]
MTADRIELAPVVPVRVAAWPLRAITDFGRTPVATAEDDERARASAHEVALAADRALLWARTVEDPRFMRALAVANAELARSILGRTCPARRDKRTRHLETTLYRYLARASTRPQPGDMWAGATLAQWGATAAIRPRIGRVAVAPDLGPFRELVQALATRPSYVERGPYKLNPTLSTRAGEHVFWTPPRREGSVRRRLEGPGVGDVLSALAGASWTLSAAADAVGKRLRIGSDAARRIVETLRVQTALVGGLGFPRRFRDAWQALELVEAALEPRDAERWRAARRELFDAAEAVARVVASADPPAILAAMDSARAVVVALATGLAVEPFAAPRAPLRCDVEAPWAIRLGREAHAAAARTIESLLRHQQVDGLREPLLAAVASRVVGPDAALGTVEPPACVAAAEGIVSWEAIAARYDAGPELRRRCRRLRERLDAAADEIRI